MSHLKITLSGALLAISSVVTIGCTDQTDHDFARSQQASLDEAANQGARFFTPEYDPTQGKIPFPSHLVYDQRTQRVALPIEADTPSTDPRRAVNQLDGFSISAPISLSFSQALAPSSLVMGQTVRVFQLNTAGNSIVAELGASELLATAVDKTLYLIPLKPLKESTQYLVGLTSGIQSTRGENAQESLMYSLLSGSNNTAALSEDPQAQALLSAIQAGNNGFEALLSAAGVSDNIITSWRFRTQTIQAGLAPLLAAADSAESLAEHRLTLNYLAPLAAINPQTTANGQVFAGKLRLPYYLGIPTQADPTALRRAFFTTNGEATPAGQRPDSTATIEIPVLAILPSGLNAAPMMIYQHGITTDRTTVLGVADSYLRAGRGLIAIDIPLHGISPAHPLYASLTAAQAGATERTFAVDLVDNTSGNAGADGQIDPSGEHFINLSSLLTARDNMRQAIADLLVLRRSLTGATINNAPSNEGIDASEVGFVGHSLGGIIGTTYTALEPQINHATLGMSGSQIAYIFSESATFGPVLRRNLAAAGIDPDSPEFAQFVLLSQTVFDAVDPLSFAERFSAQGNRAQLIEIVGDSQNNLADQVVPNGGQAALPLMGSEGLSRLLGLENVANQAGVQTLSGTGAITRFTQGDHGSFARPSGSGDVYREIQQQISAFALSRGASVTVQDPSYIANSP